MSEEQLKAFLNALKADTGLQAKIKAAVEGEIDTPDEIAAVLAIAKEAGFGITAADLHRNQAQEILELSDEELEGVAGGNGRPLFNLRPWAFRNYTSAGRAGGSC
jgi:predicted ribosomally synthesized peptide with nif11-like leader